MAIFRPNIPDNQMLVQHSRESGVPWRGCAFNTEGKYLGNEQPRFSAGVGPAFDGSALRPLPGQKPLCHSFSYRHDGVLSGQDRTKFEKMTLWCLTDTSGADGIIGLFNHGTALPGSAKAHPFPNEWMILDAAPAGLNVKIFRNYAPILAREADYDFDLDPGTVFNGLLNVSAKATSTGFQRGEASPSLWVMASDRNPCVALGPGEGSPPITYRQLGLNAPQFDINTITPIPIASDTAVGPQIPIRLASGSAGSGPADWSLDPDEVWSLVNGSIIEFNTGYPVGITSVAATPDSRLFVAIPALSGALSGASLQFRGTAVDQETAVRTDITGSADSVSISSASVATNAQGTTVPQWLWVNWDTNYASANSYEYDPNNGSGVTYPRAVVVNGNAEGITRIVAHRAGRAYRRDNEASQILAAYAWERRDGTYSIRGATSGIYERFPVDVPAGYQLRLLGNYGPPLESELPNYMQVCIRAFNINVENGTQEPDRNGGVAAGMQVVREVPIHKTDVATNEWKTNTGFPNHDIVLNTAVIDNWLDDQQIAYINDVIPDTLLAMGGCNGVTAIGSYLAFWGFPRFDLSEVTISDGDIPAPGVLASTTFTSTTDDFIPWFIGRQIVFGGKAYLVFRVTRERKTLPATLFVYEKRPPGAVDETGPAYFAEDKSTLWIGMGQSLYGENTCPQWSTKVPGNEEITSVTGTGANTATVTTREGSVYDLLITPTGTIFKAVPDALSFRWSLRTSSHGAAGNNATALVEDEFAVHTGRNISMGVTPSNMADVTSDDNARLWTDLFNPAFAENSVLRYDSEQRQLVLGNVQTQIPTYPGITEYGIVIDMEEGGALSTQWPWLAKAMGVAKLPRAQSAVAQATGSRLTQWKYGPIVFFVDVATVGSNPLTGVTVPGPYIVVYDVPTNTWSAIPCNTDDALNYDGTMEPGNGDNAYPVSGTHSSIQTADGKIVCLFGWKTSGGNTHFPWIVRLVRSTTGTWSVDGTEYAEQSGLFPPCFALVPSRDKSFFALRRLQPLNDPEIMAVCNFDANSVKWPYLPEVGGRQAALTGTAFQFEDSDTTNNCVQALQVGNAGELFVFSYVYAGGGPTGTLTIRRLNPDTLAPIDQDDPTLTVADPGNPNVSAANYGVVPRRGPGQFALNRHGELWFIERRATDNGAADGPLLALNRYRFADNGYTAATTTANTRVTGQDAIDAPGGKGCLLIDQRQQTWFAYSKTMPSGDLGFHVVQFAEASTLIDQVDIERTDYDRELISMVSAGKNVWYLVKDTPSGGGTSTWRIIKAIGQNTLIDGSAADDGTPYVISSTSSPQEEDPGNNSVYYDLDSTIAGTGGALSYAACDTQMDQATCQPCDASATMPLRMYGLAQV